jgi:hypothetical protein
MNSRAYLLTIGTALALMAPAACASAAGPDRSPRAERGLQAVVFGDAAAAKQPVGTIRGVRKTAVSSVEPHYFRVRRNSI